MASPRKIIAVVGATGNQGSSVAHEFLKLPNWQVRCLTRSPSSPASLALRSLGAEIVQADLSDASSLAKAFANANAIFLNTDFWETYRILMASPSADDKESAGKVAFDTEILCGKNAISAAAAVSSLERLVYSTLPPMGTHSKGKYTAYHSNSKPTIVEYIKNEHPKMAQRTSFIYLGGYLDNPMLSPRLDSSSGQYKFVSPLAKRARLPIIDPKNSTGPFVRALIEDEKAGTKLFAYDSYLFLDQIVDLWSKASGKEAGYVGVTTEIMHQKFGVSKEVLDAPNFINEYGYMGGVDDFIEPSELKKKVATKSFEDWLSERDWKSVLESLNVAK